MKLRFLSFFTFMFLSVLVSGCARLQWLDDKAGEVMDNIPQVEDAITEGSQDENEATSSQAISQEATSTKATTTNSIFEIPEEARAKIDAWLEANNLNHFGDPVETMYTGGTPLFNELTGETKDRYQYLLEKIPDLLEKIKN